MRTRYVINTAPPTQSTLTMKRSTTAIKLYSSNSALEYSNFGGHSRTILTTTKTNPIQLHHFTFNKRHTNMNIHQIISIRSCKQRLSIYSPFLLTEIPCCNASLSRQSAENCATASQDFNDS